MKRSFFYVGQSPEGAGGLELDLGNTRLVVERFKEGLALQEPRDGPLVVADLPPRHPHRGEQRRQPLRIANIAALLSGAIEVLQRRCVVGAVVVGDTEVV